MTEKPVAGLPFQLVNDKGRSHQQSQAPFLRGIEFRADAAHSRRASEITDILEAVVAGKVREIAIAREVGDSVLYRSLFESASPQWVLSALFGPKGAHPREAVGLVNHLPTYIWP